MNARTMNEEEDLESVEHTHGEVMPRIKRNNDADEPPEGRARVETVTQPKWTLDSRVREVLVETPKLNDFLRNNVGGRGVVDSNENVTMETFAIKPDMFIQDEELRMLITALPAYEEIKEDIKENIKVRNTLREVARNLEKAGVNSLGQWDEFTDKESILLMARGKLNAALDAAKRQMHVSQDTTPVVMKGVYESVYNATWHYVEGVGGEGFGMQVKEGHPPQPWKEDEVMKGSAEDDNNNEKPEDGRLELMVLTSKEGWPYTEFSVKKSCDIYVNKEVKRTWHKILKKLDEYFVDSVDAKKELTPYVLMGTPGIGKSFAAGSFLLYQLLHYDSERLQVVAYFIQGGAYLFEKKSDSGKVTWYEEEKTVLSVIRGLSKHKRGYIIYDVAGKKKEPPLSLPPSGWGMIVISSPNEDQYKEWKKQKGAHPIVINCPTLREIKAMCAWEKRNQSDELEDYWKTIKERINNIGPLLRFVFNDGLYRIRCKEVRDAVDLINDDNVSEYKNIIKGNAEWKDKSPSHKLVKIYRLDDDDDDLPRNATFTNELNKKVLVKVMGICHDPYLSFFFTNRGTLVAQNFEKYGVLAFTDSNFVTALREVLKILKPLGRRSKKSVLQQGEWVTYASKGYHLFPTSINDRSTIEYNRLYYPPISNFPVVDAFFFVKSEEERVTMIGIQATISTSHDTTVTAVDGFIKYLKTCFSDWATISEKVLWEIVYMQPYETDESRQIREWQRCALNESRRDTIEEQKVIEKFWNERVNQYQVNLSSRMAFRLVEALEEVRKEENLSKVEDLMDEKKRKKRRRI